MKRELLAICGPFSINSYGVAIALGILLFMWLIKKHPKAIALHLDDKITDILLVSIFAGILGGRAWYFISEPETEMSLFGFLSLWDGGFSLLGSVMGIIGALIYYLQKIDMPVLPCLDIIAVHAPLLQSVSRIGCFFAGCCYGRPTDSVWGVTYTDPQSMAPLQVTLHPAQLYSAINLLGIFFLLYCVLQKKLTKPGQLFATYLMLISAERFYIDYWRADRVFNSSSLLLPSFIHNLSTHQLMALYIFITAALFFIYVSIKKSNTQNNPNNSSRTI